MKTTFRSALLVGLACWMLSPAMPVQAAPEAFEIGPHNVNELPRGKEADGIIGDFVLRNNRVEAVISHNALLRRANMSTFWGAGGITPGCLYDLTLRGENNDQITIFSPSGQQGPVSYVRIAEDGSGGAAAVETVVTAANNRGLYKRHEYRLEEDWQGVLIVTTYRNEGTETRRGAVADRWTRFRLSGSAEGIEWADAIDPADKAGYAYGWVEHNGLKEPPLEVTLRPGQEISYARFLAVGRSPLEAWGLVAARRGPAAPVSGRVVDAAGAPVTTATLHALLGQNRIPGYPDEQGRFTFHLPHGAHAFEISDLGRETVQTERVRVGSPGVPALDVKMSIASAVQFDIRDEAGRSIPCKAQFIGLEGTPNPNLGPMDRARGCVDQYHSETGQFRVQLPPGQYRIIVTRGIEFSHLDQTIRLEPGRTETVRGTLRRLVDSSGWISADFHNHSTPSGDNTCGTYDRVINLAAEHIEFAPTTEHNRLYDWGPYIEKLGLSEFITTIPGMELTGPGAHFNAFPFVPDPFTQDNGAPVWQQDPRLNAIVLRDFQGANPERWVHLNHPNMVENFIDRHGDGREDGGYWGLGQLIDALETQNYRPSDILAGAPFRIVRNQAGRESVQYIREFIWLQLLNRGHRLFGVAVADAHSVYGNGVGGWRMYIPSSTDNPAEIDWKEVTRHAKAGRTFLTTGPFLEVRTDDGILPGGLARATDAVHLRVRVQCTDWIDIDRIQVLVNGRQRPDLNFTRGSHPDWFQDGVVKFERVISVPLSQDSHVIVVAYGENFDLRTGYGTSPQSALKPCAYNNPIFVDVDGGGFTPNGDTLGFELPVAGLSVEQVKALLDR